MKGRVKDTIWFGKENGSSMKISWEGYSTEHVEELKQDFVNEGWIVLYHQHKIVNDHWYDRSDIFLGGFVIFAAIVTLWWFLK